MDFRTMIYNVIIGLAVLLGIVKAELANLPEIILPREAPDMSNFFITCLIRDTKGKCPHAVLNSSGCYYNGTMVKTSEYGVCERNFTVNANTSEKRDTRTGTWTCTFYWDSKRETSISGTVVIQPTVEIDDGFKAAVYKMKPGDGTKTLKCLHDKAQQYSWMKDGVELRPDKDTLVIKDDMFSTGVYNCVIKVNGIKAKSSPLKIWHSDFKPVLHRLSSKDACCDQVISCDWPGDKPPSPELHLFLGIQMWKIHGKTDKKIYRGRSLRLDQSIHNDSYFNCLMQLDGVGSEEAPASGYKITFPNKCKGMTCYKDSKDPTDSPIVKLSTTTPKSGSSRSVWSFSCMISMVLVALIIK